LRPTIQGHAVVQLPSPSSSAVYSRKKGMENMDSDEEFTVLVGSLKNGKRSGRTNKQTENITTRLIAQAFV
jgi:hypothetical protein